LSSVVSFIRSCPSESEVISSSEVILLIRSYPSAVVILQKSSSEVELQYFRTMSSVLSSILFALQYFASFLFSTLLVSSLFYKNKTKEDIRIRFKCSSILFDPTISPWIDEAKTLSNLY